MTVRVNSWNSWDPLKHIVIGKADGGMIQAPEIAVERDWPTYGFPRGTFGPFPQEMVQRANAQLDELARLLETHGVRVDRPTPLDFSKQAMTPDWVQHSMVGCMPPRDVLITVGSEILEAAMSYRSRWYEYLCYRPLLQSYYKDDKRMRWEAAPKPRLTKSSYHENFWSEYGSLNREQQIELVRANGLLLTETEPIFDAADIGRFGSDLFVQLSLATNRLGYRWIKQHFSSHRVHAVTFGQPKPMHIDATWVGLKPGLVLACGERPAEPDMVEYFKVNDWEVIEAASPSRSPEELPPMCYCSPWLSINILSLDSKTVCVEAEELALAEQLDRLGFNVLAVSFWDVAPFGGGLHCATLDIERNGDREDYFPRRCGRF